MKRIEKIYQYVKEQTKNLTPMTLTSDAESRHKKFQNV